MPNRDDPRTKTNGERSDLSVSASSASSSASTNGSPTWILHAKPNRANVSEWEAVGEVESSEAMFRALTIIRRSGLAAWAHKQGS